jgi:hypothetical protein
VHFGGPTTASELQYFAVITHRRLEQTQNKIMPVMDWWKLLFLRTYITSSLSVSFRFCNCSRKLRGRTASETDKPFLHGSWSLRETTDRTSIHTLKFHRTWLFVKRFSVPWNKKPDWTQTQVKEPQCHNTTIFRSLKTLIQNKQHWIKIKRKLTACFC